jgi:hypothetical protein
MSRLKSAAAFLPGACSYQGAPPCKSVVQADLPEAVALSQRYGLALEAS